MHYLLNPGHGLKNSGIFDPGAVGPTGYKEAIQALEVANELAALLQSAGHRVTIYQDGDLADVVNFEKKTKPDRFVSIHCNSSVSSTARGVEVYICGRGGRAEKMAIPVCLHIANSFQIPNRGVKIAQFDVIAKTNSPAILIETEFISNPDAERQMKDPAYDKKMAQAIFKGLMEAEGLSASCPTCGRALI